jgi:hypothetical protein
MGEKLCDRVVLSVNESWLYFDFWPMVAYAYRTIFPECLVTLVFLTERLEHDPVVAAMRQHGEVVLVRPVKDITQAAQTKMARYWYAAQRDGEVCYIDDIDEVPIDREWHLSKTRQRKPGSMLYVGSEVYHGEGGQAPASQMTAEGHIFRQLFNPGGLPFPEWLYSLRGHAMNIDSRTYHEGMECTTSAEAMNAPLFSDEQIILELRKERPTPETYATRDYHVGVNTIDRSYMAMFSRERLEAGGYLCAHTGRPYADHREANDMIVDYIRRRYSGGPAPGVVTRTPGVDEDMVFGGSGMTEDAFRWICDHVPAGSMIVEIGSGHVSTNYLSRYYFVVTVESDLNFVNLYPAHYIYAPLTQEVSKDIAPSGTWYNHAAIVKGLDHPRLNRRKRELLIVDGPVGENRAPVLDSGLFSFDGKVMIDDVWRPSERGIAEEVSRRTGRAVEWFEQFAVLP